MHRVKLTSGRAVQFMLFTAHTMLQFESVSCGEGSGSGGGSGCIDGTTQLVPLVPPGPGSMQDSGLFLSPVSACGGWVRGWSYCYYSPSGTNDDSVTAELSLWRVSGEMLIEVEGSKLSVEMKRLPVGQWLACEARALGEGCGVEMKKGDYVGVLIPQRTSLSVLGEVEGECVKWVENVTGGSVENDSLSLRLNMSLLVTPRISSCVCRGAGEEEVCSNATSTPSPPTTPPTTGTPNTSMWVSVGLGVLVLVLFALLCFFLCVTFTRKNRAGKSGPISTVVLNSHRRSSDVVAETDVVEIHVLDTGSSTHSTSISPTPNGAVAAAATQVLQVEKRKTPPPVKPKPRHLSSKKNNLSQPMEVKSQTPPQFREGVVIPSDPAHHASFLRSYSEEAIQLQPHGLQRRLSTGSLPTPCLDEDDYTIPCNSFANRSHLRPQPYLQPKTLEYSYAYSHVMRERLVTGGSQTVPRTRAALPPCGTPPARTPGELADDYDEIFVDKYWQEMRAANRTNHTPPLFSHTPSIAEQLRLMSAASDGYMNSDQFPRPSTATLPVTPPSGSPDKPHPMDPKPRPLEPEPRPLKPSGSLDQHQPLHRHYTPLHPSVRKLSSSYEVPRGNGFEVPSSPLLFQFTSDYDHLDSDPSLNSNNS